MLPESKYYKYKSSKLQYNKENFVYNALKLFAIAFVFALIARIFWFYPYIIKTNSMVPKIPENTFIMFIKPKVFVLKKGKVVLVQNQYSSAPLFCEIIAIEGESLKIQNRTVYINDTKINPKKFFFSSQYQSNIKNIKLPLKDNHYPVVHIKPDHFFCINNNWENTYDSRTFGVFHKSSIQKELLFYNFFRKVR